MESIVTLIIGVVFIVIGIMNRKGNVSMLHSYHRARVSEEDMLPFGKMVGLGMLTIGVSLILMAVFSFLALRLNQPILTTIGIVCMVVGFVVGIAISFYAMIKYNKGIF